MIFSILQAALLRRMQGSRFLAYSPPIDES